jgi:hypothetical protein
MMLATPRTAMRTREGFIMRPTVSPSRHVVNAALRCEGGRERGRRRVSSCASLTRIREVAAPRRAEAEQDPAITPRVRGRRGPRVVSRPGEANHAAPGLAVAAQAQPEARDDGGGIQLPSTTHSSDSSSYPISETLTARRQRGAERRGRRARPWYRSCR